MLHLITSFYFTQAWNIISRCSRNRIYLIQEIVCSQHRLALQPLTRSARTLFHSAKYLLSNCCHGHLITKLNAKSFRTFMHSQLLFLRSSTPFHFALGQKCSLIRFSNSKFVHTPYFSFSLLASSHVFFRSMQF